MRERLSIDWGWGKREKERSAAIYFVASRSGADFSLGARSVLAAETWLKLRPNPSAGEWFFAKLRHPLRNIVTYCQNLPHFAERCNTLPTLLPYVKLCQKVQSLAKFCQVMPNYKVMQSFAKFWKVWQSFEILCKFCQDFANFCNVCYPLRNVVTRCKNLPHFAKHCNTANFATICKNVRVFFGEFCTIVANATHEIHELRKVGKVCKFSKVWKNFAMWSNLSKVWHSLKILTNFCKVMPSCTKLWKI